MAKVKYDVSGASPGGDWEHVKPGLYQMKITAINVKDSKAGNPMLEVVMKPHRNADGSKLDGEFNNVWYYILTDGSQDGRVRSFTDALGIPAKGTLDTDEHVNAIIQAQLKSDKDQDGEYRPRVAKVMPLPEDAETEADDEEEGDDEEEDEGVDLATLNRTQLKALIKDNELDIKVLKSMSDDDIRAAITEALGGAEDEEEEEAEAEEEEEDDSVDLATLDRAELKKLIKDNELDIRVLKSMSDDDLRAKIAEALGAGPASDEEEDDEEESDNGYASMSIQDLKNALKERGLKTTGAKKDLAARLTEDDSKGGDPF